MPVEILDEDVLYRRVPPSQIVRDPKVEGGWRVSSGDWDDSDLDKPSVYCARLLADEGLTLEAVLIDHAEFSLVEIKASEVRALEGLGVLHAVDDEDLVPARGKAHCGITGLPDANQMRKKARERLARDCRIVLLREPRKP